MAAIPVELDVDRGWRGNRGDDADIQPRSLQFWPCRPHCHSQLTALEDDMRVKFIGRPLKRVQRIGAICDGIMACGSTYVEPLENLCLLANTRPTMRRVFVAAQEGHAVRRPYRNLPWHMYARMPYFMD